MEHSRLVEALKDPGFYDHPVESVEFLQTHISSVFMTGDYAYKLKKPVNFGFLDFTTPELRQRFCEAEVALNRRLAPDVYLGVKPIFEKDGQPALAGAGEPVDWLVFMRQMDQRLLGPEVLARGELREAHVDRLVDLLVPFYQEAASGAGVEEHGRIETVKFNTDENFEQTADFVGSALSEATYSDIRIFTDAFLADRADLFERRVAEGRIRECHGDLHLGNIVLSEPPVIFDCIEFNERFRCSDVAVDVAFLAMDLDFRDRPELARRFISRYVSESGDEELVELMDFYCCYRAYVRGKIACFTSADPGLDESVRSEQLELAGRYFDLAHRYAGHGGGGR